MTLTKFQVKDYGQGLLDAPISSGALSMQVKAGDAAKFPSVYPFFLTLEEILLSEYGVESIVKYEQVKVTNVVGEVMTIERGQNGTTSYGFSADDRVSLHLVSKVIQDMQDAIVSLETGKLDTDSLRAGLTANRIPYTNGSGGEILLAFWSAGQVLGISGSALAFITPTSDINGLVEVITIDRDNDELVVYDASAGVNRKVKVSNIAKLATTWTAGLTQLADSTAVTDGTAGRVIDAAQLKSEIAKVDLKAVTASINIFSGNTGTITVPHTLGRVPEVIHTRMISNGTSTAVGIWTSGAQNSTGWGYNNEGYSSACGSPRSDAKSGTITAVDSTDITINVFGWFSVDETNSVTFTIIG